nr:reverse transcriptase domain-containing protein [Tanacetum cinerariifolium]
MATLTDMMTKLVSTNTASSSRSGTLPGNTVTNPKEELKGITTQSGVTYQGPKTPPSKQGTKVTKDQVQNPSSQNTAPVQPSVIQSDSQALVSEPVTSRALIDVHKGELTLRIGNEAITYNLDQTGDILLLEAILNSEPSPPLPNQEQNLPSFKEELKAYEAQTVKSSVNEPPEVELKDMPHHLEYAFLEGDNKLLVIIGKELRSEEKVALIKVLKSHKRAIAWKL